jgi:predicted ATPase/DNA-binding SARP family transcriptional activator
MPRLVIQVLGPFIVTKDGQPVVFSYDKVRALLVYLVVAARQSVSGTNPISRARLASLLWPDQPQSAAQDSLRQALSRLRSLIDDRDALTPFLLVEHDTVQVNQASSLEVDLYTFEDALAKAAAHHHRSLPSCPICAAQLEKAAGLMCGDFLEDLSLPDSDLFENWATTQRERIKIQALEVFSELAQFYERRGDPDRTLTYATCQIQIDPYHEPAHRQIMQALVRSGQRSQAVLHFNRLKQLLEDDLGILPTTETLALFETIRQGNNLPDPFTVRVHNLPVPLAPLVGRSVELSELLVWISDPDRRLISLVGPGGVGKTRLAIQAVQQAACMFSGGALFVTLTRIAAAATQAASELPAALAAAIAGALGITGSVDPWPQVLAALAKQEMLLVLDGVEHVLAGCARVAELLEANPGLVILTTTRQRLDLPGEWIFGLGGLDTPPAYMKSQMEAYSAVSLFCQCARQVNPSFELSDANQASIGEICRLVDGLPLAIRLAAAWSRSLSCTEIAAEISRSLDILSGQPRPGMEAGQSSVRAVFEQSWNQLAPPDREVFQRLSVFRGGFDRAAAEHVAGATIETLTRLVDQSLIRMSLEGRYDLHDLLSQFGAEKLQQAGVEIATRRRHFEWYFAQVEKNEQMLNSQGALNAFIWLIREAANLRETMTWAQANAPEQIGQLARWMHSDFHQTGLHVFVQQNKPRS